MPLDPGQARELAAALGSYRRLMEQEVVPESQYYLLGRREIPSGSSTSATSSSVPRPHAGA
ncbi:hypothetical protein [Actinomadura nitritigenes]|uniref:hypothetical protein n=1 Tax=Actinomadura nitritigenes TaxID=134602 RepID=UPI003D8B756D